MVIEAEERMVRVERTCERIHERLGLIEHRLTTIEPRLTSGVVSLGYEMKLALDTLRSEVRAGDGQLRRQGTAYFYWLLTLVAAPLLVVFLLELIP